MKRIQRPCQSSLRSWNPANGSRRTFSQTCTLSRRFLPVFAEPSTPELASLLGTVNARILLPKHLTKEQRALVYKEENKTRLEADPIDITIGEVTLQLEHLDTNRLPNLGKHVGRIMHHSTTISDWENVVRLIEGFQSASIPLNASWRERIVRKLHQAGNHPILLKALQRPDETGLRLSEYNVLKQVIRGIHEPAAQAGWAEEETSKALRQARQIVELLESDEHCGAIIGENTEEKGDWRGSPIVIALPTELVAKLAELHGGDKEEVRKLVNRLLYSLKQSNYTQTSLEQIVKRSASTPADYPTGFGQQKAVFAQFHELVYLSIIVNALKTSRKVLGTDMPLADEAQVFEQQLEEALNEGVKNIDVLSERNGKRWGEVGPHCVALVDKIR